MKKTFLILLFALGGFCAAQTSAPPALSISGSTCIPAGSSGHTYSLSAPSLTGAGYSVVSCQWEAFGGITINGSANTPTVTVDSQNGTDYYSNFSKYGKGKLLLKATLQKVTTFTYNNCCTGEKDVTGTSTDTKELFAEFDICKIFSIPDGDVTNEIVGPECISQGETVTYSVAPWVTLSDPGKVGFDDYNWFPNGTIPPFVANGILYYSADKSSITFVVGSISDSSDNTISVQIGRCNAGNPSSVLTKKLSPTPPDPIIEMDGTAINWENGLCLPLGKGKTTISVANAQQGATYTWENLDGWTYSQNGANLTFTPMADAREIRLRAKNSCGDEKTYNLKINRSFNSSSVIQTDEGTCLTGNASVQFWVSNAADGQAIQWSVNGEGWDIANNNIAKPTIHVGTGTGIATATDVCGTSISETFQIRPNTPEAIEGTTCLPTGSTDAQTYSIAPVANADSYRWYTSGGLTIQGDNTGTSVTVIPDGTSGGTISVYAKGCKNSSSQALNVGIAPAPLTGISVSKDCINSGMEDEITLTAEGGDYDTYEWNVDGIGTIAGNANGKTITVNTDGIDGTYNISVVGKATGVNVGVCAPAKPVSRTIPIAGVDLTVAKEDEPDNEGGFYFYYLENPPQGKYTYKWNVDGELSAFGVNSTSMYSEIPDLLMPSNGHTLEILATKAGCTTRRLYPTETAVSLSKNISLQSISSVDKVSIDKSRGDIIVSPNPANSFLNISLPNEMPSEIRLFDIHGKMVKSEVAIGNKTTLDISSMASGTYAISVMQGDKVYQKMVIIKK